MQLGGHIDDIAFGDRRRCQFRLHRENHLAQRTRPRWHTARRHDHDRGEVGACKPDQKPGDIVVPGGFKLNIEDAEKLKGLVPK